MGNRAVIRFDDARDTLNNVGLYLHWNGGRNSVEAFLKACRLYRPTTKLGDIGTLVQVIRNTGIQCEVMNLDVADRDNYDNGVYVLAHDWQIVDREYMRHAEEQDDPTVSEMLEWVRECNDCVFEGYDVRVAKLAIVDEVLSLARDDCNELTNLSEPLLGKIDKILDLADAINKDGE